MGHQFCLNCWVAFKFQKIISRWISYSNIMLLFFPEDGKILIWMMISYLLCHIVFWKWWILYSHHIQIVTWCSDLKKNHLEKNYWAVNSFLIHVLQFLSLSPSVYIIFFRAVDGDACVKWCQKQGLTLIKACPTDQDINEMPVKGKCWFTSPAGGVEKKETSIKR